MLLFSAKPTWLPIGTVPWTRTPQTAARWLKTWWWQCPTTASWRSRWSLTSGMPRGTWRWGEATLPTSRSTTSAPPRSEPASPTRGAPFHYFQLALFSMRRSNSSQGLRPLWQHGGHALTPLYPHIGEHKFLSQYPKNRFLLVQCRYSYFISLLSK